MANGNRRENVGSGICHVHVPLKREKGAVLDVSVVIPHYGDAEPTLELVAALQEQETTWEYEIIVSDDCSPVPFPETDGIIVTRRIENGGFGANVNNGVASATGKWLLIMNSDLHIAPGFIQALVDAGEAEGDVLLSPQVLGHEGQGQWVGRRFPTTFHHAWEWFTPVARFRETSWWHRLVGHDLRCVTGARALPDWLMGACMLVQADTYRRVGGMDEQFFMNSEETDLQRRLAETGIPRVFRGDITVGHVGGGSSGPNTQRRQWVTNSRFIYGRKWGQGKNLGTSLRAVSLLNFIFNLLRSIRNKDVKPSHILRYELSIIKQAETT